MDRIGPLLARHHVVGFDTSVFIYVLEGRSPYTDISSDILRFVQQGALFGVTSVVSLMELIVKPLRMNQTGVARQYERLLQHFPNFSIIEIDQGIARRAAGLRARYGLRTPDALHLAACISAGATIFVTNDAIFRRIQELQVIYLNDIV